MAKRKKSGKTSKTPSKRQLTMWRKEAQTFTLRMAGAGYERIAQIVGYADASGAYRAFHRALARLIIDEPNEQRLLELSRLDAIQIPIFERAQRGDIEAIDTYLKIANRRAKLIGLDAPTKVEHDWQRELIDAGIEDPAETFEEMVQFFSDKLNVSDT